MAKHYHDKWNYQNYRDKEDDRIQFVTPQHPAHPPINVAEQR